MASHSCAVAECSNGGRKTVHGTTLHSFPWDNPSLCKIWISKCKKEVLDPKTASICSKHFKEDDYEDVQDVEQDLLNVPPMRMLKPDAIPSVFDEFWSSLPTPGSNDPDGDEAKILARNKERITEESITSNSDDEEKYKLSAVEESNMSAASDQDYWTCLFCRKMLEDDEGIWELTNTQRSSLAKSCFQENSQHLYDFLFLIKPEETSLYCNGCCKKITEIRLVYKNIKKLRLRMKDLVCDLEAFVIQKYGRYNPLLDEEDAGTQGFDNEVGSSDAEGPASVDADNDVYFDEFEDGSKRAADTPPKHTRSTASKLRCTVPGCSELFSTELQRYEHVREHEYKGRRATQSQLEFQQKRNEILLVEPMRYPCTVPDCKRVFTQPFRLHKHIKNFHENPPCFKCNYCEKECSTKGELTIHERKHTGETPFPCTTCGKQFSASLFLRRHMKLHSDKYVCELCGKRFVNSTSLKRHAETHSSVKPYFCELCGYTCSTKRYLESHQANQHEGETGLVPIKCSICDRKFSKAKALDNHMISIHKLGEAKYRCEHCEHAFHNSRELGRHVDTVHLKIKTHMCPLCGEKFASTSNLRAHTERHHVAKEQRERPFECSFCSKKFHLRRTMKNHEAIHSGERPFPCQLCTHRFPSKSYLDLHVYTVHEKRRKKKRGLKNVQEDEEPHIDIVELEPFQEEFQMEVEIKTTF